VKRRDFLKGLLASTAVAAVAPAALERGTVLTIEDVRRCVDVLREQQVAWQSEFYFGILSPNRLMFFSELNDPETWDMDEGTSLVEPTKAAVGHWNGVTFVTPVHEDAA
jgi:TAT (twin-arginine translocation) pathway signal sequence